MPKKTPLNAIHRAAGARMVDFGGWDMPVNYGSQIDEHHAVRNDAGMFDVSHMRVVDLEGDGARAFLRGALANNVDKLKVAGKALYSCLLTPQGTVIDDLIVYFLREDFFRLVVNAGTADKDVAWLSKLAAERAPGLRLTPRADLAMVAVQGPNARAKVWQVIPGSEAAGANGLEVSKDGKWLYVAAWGSQSFFRLSRGQTPPKRDEIPLGFRVDNVRWAGDGSLLAAGQAGTAPAQQTTNVVKINPTTLKVQEIIKQPYSDSFGAGTVAVEVGKEIWVGSFRGDRIARFPATTSK